jgi:hypothetical protein
MISFFNKFYKTIFSLFFGLQLFLIYIVYGYSFSSDFGTLVDFGFNTFALNEISFWSQFQSEIYEVISISNPIFFNIIGFTIFVLSKLASSFFIFSILPILILILCFWLMLRIFEFYSLPKSWSYLLSFLGLTSTSNLTLWNSLIAFISGDGILKNYDSFDLVYSLSGSLTLFSFLALFNLSIRSIYLNSKLLGFMPLLWCLSAFIHPSIFIFGFTFFFILLSTQLYRNYVNGREVELSYLFLINFLPLLIVIPYLILNLNFFGSSDALIVSTLNTETLLREITTYCLMPIIMMLIFSYLYRVDPYEQIIRFWPIIILSILEILFRVTIFINLFSINHNYIIDNISIYFLHFLYYVPFLSIIARKPTYDFKGSGAFDVLSENIRSYTFKFSTFAGPTLAIFFTIFIFSSQSKSIDQLNLNSFDTDARYFEQIRGELINYSQLKSKNGVMLSPQSAMLDNFLNKNYPNLNSYLVNGTSFTESEFLHVYMLSRDINNFSPTDSSKETALLSWLVFNRIQPSKPVSLDLDKVDNFFEDNFLISQEEINIQDKIPGLEYLVLNEDSSKTGNTKQTHHIYFRL